MRCGCKYDRAQLSLEWTNLLVCVRCLDPRPAELTPPYIDPFEGAPIKNPIPRAPDSFVGATDDWTCLDGETWATLANSSWYGTFRAEVDPTTL